MKKKVLYIATSDIHLRMFHKPYISWLAENDCQVDLAYEKRGNEEFDGATEHFQLIFPRSIFSIDLLKSYKELKNIINGGDYNLIYCHTPIPSMLTRLAARKARINGTKVLYMVHGFHFYKGGPISRWLTYYPVERFLSKYTDGIVTVNQEDFGYIQRKFWKQTDSFNIKGIGVNPSSFRPFLPEEIIKKRKELKLNDNNFVLFYVAEFIPRKNHQLILLSLNNLYKTIPNLKVIFAGRGSNEDNMKKLCRELKLDNVVSFLGFRKDIPQLAAMADVGISTSKHEGLPIGINENMMCGIPIIASKVRGHTDLVTHGKEGFLFIQGNIEEFSSYVIELYKKPEKRREMGENAVIKAKEFEISNSLNSMTKIFKNYL